MTTDIPEHSDLKNDPNTDWDTRARGLGGTLGNPVTTNAEENINCLSWDPWRGQGKYKAMSKKVECGIT